LVGIDRQRIGIRANRELDRTDRLLAGRHGDVSRWKEYNGTDRADEERERDDRGADRHGEAEPRHPPAADDRDPGGASPMRDGWPGGAGSLSLGSGPIDR
jgi:hypothetical protein